MADTGNGKENMIKTSVIIPVYNTSLYLEECIGSVFSQTQKEIEVIAINDGSTDDSWEVLLSLQKKYPQLIIMTQENHGLGYVRNVGIERARGEYIYFLDSDDYILENTLESCYECAAKNKLDIVVIDALVFEDSVERKTIEPNNCDRHDIIKEREEIFSGIYFLEKYYRKLYNPMSQLMYCSATFLKENNIWFLTGVYFEDHGFYCKAMTLADRIMYIPKMFYQYRCRKDSITGSKFDLRKAKDHIEVISALDNLRSIRDGEGWHVIKRISLSMLLYVANVCYDNHLYDIDRELYIQILNTWTKICGSSIENADDLENVNYIYRICIFFPDSEFGEIKTQITNRRRQLLIQAFSQLPLSQKEARIAIYGSGKYTDTILDFYEEWIGAIKADIIFLDSYIKEGSLWYRGYMVYPVSEVEDKELDCILVSSPQYEEEMCDIIGELYGNKFVTIMLYGDLHIDI